MIKILCVGKVKEAHLESLILDYKKRIEPYHKILIEEVKDYPNPESESLNQTVIDQESLSLLDKIHCDDKVILLDLSGQLKTSEEISSSIQAGFNQSAKNVVFVIGGSLGVNQALRQRANERWKLSSNTFPHALVRLLVLEQVYRAFRILNNHPYHK